MPLNDNSFPACEKLKKGKDFETVYKGKRLAGQSVVVYYFIKKETDCRKVGFTVSKKVSKSAVRRNKIKRRFREIYRLNRALLPNEIFLIIRALPKASDVNFYELKKEIVDFFSVISSSRMGRCNNQGL